MERLTKRITEATIELSAKANPFQYNGSPQRVHMKHPFWNVFDRLCKYEDLEEQCIEENQCGLRELLLKWKEFFDDIVELYDYRKAEEQGLFLRLKAKVGDLVYFPIYDYHDSAIITAIRIEENSVFFDWAQYEVGADCTEVWDEGSFSLEDIGKTVFLTREEAESALAEKGGVE